jgi:DNA processing protein
MPEPTLSVSEKPFSLFDQPAAAWLMLTRLPGFGLQTRQVFLDQVQDAGTLLAMSEGPLRSLGIRREAREVVLAWQCRDRKHPVIQEVSELWQQVSALGLDLLCWSDADYPEPLRHIHDAPLLLYLRGQRELLGREQVAIVGSRNATRAGLAHARDFAAAIGEAGYVVTSGLALGVDGAAHAGVLEAGHPTIAVIGTGLDIPYPSQHKALAGRIAEQGLMVSEYPPGTPPRAGHFPKRNRIISGLSHGVLVVEASRRSGSLITARLAMEQGREVFAIPGSVHNPLARGCHDLIRQGARLVETMDDIREELGVWWSGPPVVATTPKPKPKPAPGPLPTALDLPDAVPEQAEPGLPDHLAQREIAVLEALGYDPRSTDELCEATGLPADQLMQSLLLLELDNLVEATPGGYQKIV